MWNAKQNQLIYIISIYIDNNLYKFIILTKIFRVREKAYGILIYLKKKNNCYNLITSMLFINDIIIKKKIIKKCFVELPCLWVYLYILILNVVYNTSSLVNVQNNVTYYTSKGE